LDELPGDERGSYHTVSGLVMMRLGRMPTVGDRFEWGDLRFEVAEMDQHRVDKIVIARGRRDSPGDPPDAERKTSG
jgi:putative hemolysin